MVQDKNSDILHLVLGIDDLCDDLSFQLLDSILHVVDI